MKELKVVIGSNFGDEGKGLMTDYFAAHSKNGIVVRFNGGAQAGHTVTTPDGKRHVFGHFGAGSFAGIPTYLSSFFVVNPMTFVKEMNSLKSMGINPNVYIDGGCMVTTPYDMLINQVAEIVRDNARHGSCGLGFNETITRSLTGSEFSITVNDLLNETLLRQKIDTIRTHYNMDRLDKLGITSIPEKYKGLFLNDGIIESFIDDVSYMTNMITIADINFLKSFDTIIFEGAQGLLLDQGHEYFPHVTRSNTGMKNVSELIFNLGYENEKIEIVYVTRAYLTRHGAGPFPTELPQKPYSRIVDLTNVPNPYQGTLRFGLLDLDMLSKTIHNDLKNADGLNYNAKFALTCLDQLDEEAKYVSNSTLKVSSIQEFIEKVFEAVGFNEGYLSYGATRDTTYLAHFGKIGQTSKLI